MFAIISFPEINEKCTKLSRACIKFFEKVNDKNHTVVAWNHVQLSLFIFRKFKLKQMVDNFINILQVERPLETLTLSFSKYVSYIVTLTSLLMLLQTNMQFTAFLHNSSFVRQITNGLEHSLRTFLRRTLLALLK